jgi:soluble lytic murein transglycosylase
MLKIFKVSLLFSLSLNLFANSITTDFMQKDFKITYEWLTNPRKRTRNVTRRMISMLVMKFM